MTRLVVDLQAAQSRVHGERGIARYTLDLASAVEELRPDLVDTYVVHPDLPMMSGLYGLLGTGKVKRLDDPSVGRADVFHITSPFEPVSLDRILPEGLVDRSTRLLSTVYDIIPAIFPEVYLTERDTTEWYRGRAELLLSSDRLVAISDATRDDTVRVLGVPPGNVTSIYGGASPQFHPVSTASDLLVEHAMVAVPGLERRYVLVPSGIEWRKNVAGVFEAFSRLAPATRAGLQLVLQCSVTESQREDLAAHAAHLGIAGQVLLTGFVSDESLAALYRAAELVVFPSRYEGLGLPVLEARRCGAPVICGDNSSLRELVPDPDARFDATSVDSMAAVMERVLSNPVVLDELRRAEVPPQFDWAAAARRMASVYEEELARVRRPARGSRPRVAIVGPVPPEASGIADYLDKLLVPLSERWDVTVLTSIDPSAVRLQADVRVERLSSLEHLERFESPFDDVIHHVGNSEMHLFQPTFLRQRPGTVVLHDVRLTGLYGQIALHRPDLLPGGIGAALQRMYPGRYLSTVAGGGHLPHEEAVRLGIMMSGEVTQLATRVLVHSQFAARLVQLDSGVDAAFVHGVPIQELTPDPSEREDHLVVSFGLVAGIKLPEVIIEAVELVRLRDPLATLAFVGPIGPEERERLTAVAAQVGMGEHVTFTGAVDRDEYERWLGRATVAVQLRRWTNGESSGAAAEVLGAGVPMIASRLGAMEELPSDCVTLVPPTVGPADLADAIAAVLDQPERRRAQQAAAIRHARANSYEAAAAALDAHLFGAGISKGSVR